MPVGYSIFRDRQSPIHNQLDPRTKLLWLILLFVLSICFNHPLPLLILNLFVLIVLFVAKIRLSEISETLKLGALMGIMSVTLWPVYMHTGNLLFVIANIRVTDVALLYGFAMGLRITLMLLGATAWMLTTSPQKITAGLLQLGLPYKAGLGMSAVIRFVPLLNSERLIILEAQRARGVDLSSSSNPIKRLFQSTPIIIPLITRALFTAQNLSIAMDARGFGACHDRTSIIKLEFNNLDRVLVIIAILILISGLLMRLFGIGVLIKELL